MRFGCIFVTLVVCAFAVISCKREPDAKKIVRFEIPKGKIQRAKARAMTRLFESQKKGEVSALANSIGDKILFCGAVFVTAPDIVADDEDINPNACSFAGILDVTTNLTGQNVDFTPGQIFGPISDGNGTGTVLQNPFNPGDPNDLIVEDDNEDDGQPLIVEFGVKPGDQRQFNVVILDINSTKTGITTCDDFLANGGILRKDTDSRNSVLGHINKGANYATVIADVNEGVTEIVVEDGNSNDTELNECCGSLFNESCSTLL